MGALGIDLPFKKSRDYDRVVKFLRVIAATIGQAVRVEGLVESETKRLVAENTHLREELRERYDFANMIGGRVDEAVAKTSMRAAENVLKALGGEWDKIPIVNNPAKKKNESRL